MPYIIRAMSQAHACEISKWRYPAPYSMYDPPEEGAAEYIAHILTPHNHYHSVCDGKLLAGFCCFGEDAQVPGGDYSLPDTLDIGLGMKPELTGQGRGRVFLTAILDFAQHHYEAKQYRATVATFNKRSQKTFAQAGFQPVQMFISDFDHATEFVIMIRAAPDGTV